jgi:FAD-dependent urate hydroxylase
MALPLRIVVVGAGIGGLVAGLELSRSGYDVHVYEQHHDLRPADAGLVLLPNAVKVLNALGLRERLAGIGGRLEQFSVRSADDELLRAFPVDGLMQSTGTAVYLVARHDFHSALLQATEMERLHLGAKCVGVEQDDAGISVRFADGQRATADLLVGADGIHSAVRRYLFPETRESYAGFGHWVSTVPNDGLLAPGNGVEYLGAGKRVSMLPLGENRLYCAFASTIQRGTLPPSGGWLQPLTALFGDWPSPVGQLLDRLDEAQIRQVEVHHLEPSGHLSTGRAALVGDAAHVPAATIGQGACLAIEDAVYLARSLAATNLGVPDALRRYEVQRRARARSLVVGSRRLANKLYVERAPVYEQAQATVRATSLGDILAHLEPIVKGGPFG